MGVKRLREDSVKELSKQKTQIGRASGGERV